MKALILFLSLVLGGCSIECYLSQRFPVVARVQKLDSTKYRVSAYLPEGDGWKLMQTETMEGTLDTTEWKCIPCPAGL